jgi:hypothetical protein
MMRRISGAEARFLATRDEILARRNPELLAREKAEFEAMSDDELHALAAWSEPAHGGGVLAWLGRVAIRLGRWLASR